MTNMAALRSWSCVKFLRSKLLRPVFSRARQVRLNIPICSSSLTESNQPSRCISVSRVLQKKELVNIYFHNRDGNKVAAKASVGDNLLDVIIDNDIDIDGFGACEGTMACSTCHLIFKQADYDSIPDKPTDEELDMLDLAYGLTDTSRLGCQVYVRKDMEGWEVTVPTSVADAREP